jgi:hypothetical protein
LVFPFSLSFCLSFSKPVIKNPRPNESWQAR